MQPDEDESVGGFAGELKAIQNMKLNSKEREASRRSPLITEVIFWSSQGNLEAVQNLVAENNLDVSDEEFADYDLRTPLALAAAEGSFRVCQWLIEKGAPINKVDRFNYTPLTGAVQGNHAEVIQLLLKHGAMVYENEALLPLMESEIAQKRGLTNLAPLMDENWEIYESEVSLLRPHGAGAFGTVYQARWRGTIVAAKALKVDVLTDETAMSEFKTELALMQRLHHPHIVQFLGACTKTKKPILVTEFMYGGSLDRVFKERGTLNLDEAMKYSMHIAKGLAYLHGKTPQPVIHRDLKPANVMLSTANGGVCKIGDFGLSRTLAPIRRNRGPDMYTDVGKPHASEDMSDMFVMTGETGSYRYMSPEVFRHESYNIKADCYAFAMIAYQMFEGRQPYEGMDPIKAAAAAASNGLRPTFLNKNIPPKVKELIEELWDPIAQRRPNFMEVLARFEVINSQVAKVGGGGTPTRQTTVDTLHAAKVEQSCACSIA